MPSGQRGGGPQDPRGDRGGRQWSDQSSDRVRRIERAASERDGAPRHPSYDDPRYADGHEEPLYAQPVHDDGYGEQYDDGYGDAYAAPSYGAPTHVRSAGWDRGAEQSWGMGPGYSGGGYSRRPAVHDAWRPRRQLPPFLPTVPTLLLGLLVVILAFVLGRATGGGGGKATVAAATDTTVPVTTVTTSGVQITHTVQKGETLASIASQFGLTVDEIERANNITNPNLVFIGQRLIIPPKTPVTTTSTPTKKNSKK